MTATQRQVARKLVMNILHAALPYLMPVEPTLLAHANLVCKPPLTLTELEEMLREMESGRLIVQLRSEEGVKVRITDEGEAARQL